MNDCCPMIRYKTLFRRGKQFTHALHGRLRKGGRREGGNVTSVALSPSYSLTSSAVIVKYRGGSIPEESQFTNPVFGGIGGPVVVVVDVDHYEFQPDQANFHSLFLLIYSRLLQRRTA